MEVNLLAKPPGSAGAASKYLNTHSKTSFSTLKYSFNKSSEHFGIVRHTVKV